MFAGKKSAQIREILISESALEEMTCLFAPSLAQIRILHPDDKYLHPYAKAWDMGLYSGLTHQCLYFEQPHTFEQILLIQTAEPALVGHA